MPQALIDGAPEIQIDPAIRERARLPIQRMLDFARERGIGGRKT